jgi:hypothetical protein
MKDLTVDQLLEIINGSSSFANSGAALEELIRRARSYDRLVKENPITKTTWEH